MAFHLSSLNRQCVIYFISSQIYSCDHDPQNNGFIYSSVSKINARYRNSQQLPSWEVVEILGEGEMFYFIRKGMRIVDLQKGAMISLIASFSVYIFKLGLFPKTVCHCTNSFVKNTKLEINIMSGAAL